MTLMTMVKQLLCSHDDTTTVGTGIYAEKKNRPELRFYPVMKFICKKCNRETYYIDAKKKN